MNWQDTFRELTMVKASGKELGENEAHRPISPKPTSGQNRLVSRRHTVSRVIARPPGAHLPVTDADYLAAHASNPRLQVTTMLRAGSRYQSTNISVWMIGCASCGLVQRCHAHAGDIRENI